MTSCLFSQQHREMHHRPKPSSMTTDNLKSEGFVMWSPKSLLPVGQSPSSSLQISRFQKFELVLNPRGHKIKENQMCQRKCSTGIPWQISFEVLMAKVLSKILNLSQVRFQERLTNKKRLKNIRKATPSFHIFKLFCLYTSCVMYLQGMLKDFRCLVLQAY